MLWIMNNFLVECLKSYDDLIYLSCRFDTGRCVKFKKAINNTNKRLK